jgi:hypothetical protein
MKNLLIGFGATVALALVAVPVASVTIAAVDVVNEALDPGVYQLTLELDGQYYIEDYNLSRADCHKLLKTANDWTNGNAHRTCDRSPLLESAK